MSSKMNETNFAQTVSNMLEKSDTSQLLILFKDSKNLDQICNSAWDLVPIVAHYLTENCEDNNIKVFKCCQELLRIIVEHSPAEEVLLQFIEEVELAQDDVKLLALLNPLKTVLLQISEKRLTSLGWCFNAIRHYLEKIEVDFDSNLLGEERLLLDASDVVSRIVKIYEHLLGFCDTFIQNWTKVDKSDSLLERKHIIGKFLLELIGKPLGCLDLSVYKNTRPRVRLIAENLSTCYFSLGLDPFLYLELKDNTFGSDLVKPNNLALGVFYYLILSEEVCTECLPKVYNPAYILHNCLNLVNELLLHEIQFVLEKGVLLAEALLRTVDHLELSYLLLDCEHHAKFCKTISNVIVYNQDRSIRQKSLKILQKYLWSFEHQGRYLIILNLMQCLDHSGLKGNIITQYKEMLTKEIHTGGFKQLNKYYKKHKLFDLLDEFAILQNNEETDLVDNSDQIVSTLNFLRYLIIVDKTSETGIDCYLSTLEEGYFKHLKKGISLSKEHYQLKIKEVTEEDMVEKGGFSCQASVTVSGKNLIEMPKEKKIEVLNLSMTTLDVIDSLLSRLMECLNFKNCI